MAGIHLLQQIDKIKKEELKNTWFPHKVSLFTATFYVA
jgi:hypothetical protein